MSDSLLAAVAAAAGSGEAAPQPAPAIVIPAPPVFDAQAAAGIVTMCTAAGVPSMAATLISEGATVDQAKDRIGQAGEIQKMVMLARKSCPALEAGLADSFIAEGLSAETVRARLFDKMVVAQSPEVSPHVAVGEPKSGNSLTAVMKRILGKEAA